MTTRKPAPAPDPAEIDLDTDAGESFKAFVDGLPPDTHVGVQLYRLPHPYTPTVSSKEKLTAVEFRESYDEMQEDVRARYGPGKYLMYVRYTDPTSRRRRMVTPSFVLAPGPDDHAELIPDEAPAGPDMIQSAMDELLGAARVQSEVAKLRALRSLTDPNAPAVPTAPALDLPTLIQLAQTFRGPDLLTQLTALRAAGFPVFDGGGGGDPLGGAEKLIGIFEKVGAFGGGAAARTGWADIVLEVIRQWGPALASALPLLASMLAQARGVPVPDGPAGPIPSANPPAGPASAISGAAPMLGAPLVSDVIVQACGGDRARAERLRWWLDLCRMEYDTPTEQRADSWERAAEAADVHLPGFTDQLASWTPDDAWQFLMSVDARVLNLSNAAPWFRGFVAYLKTETPDAEKGGAGVSS